MDARSVCDVRAGAESVMFTVSRRVVSCAAIHDISSCSKRAGVGTYLRTNLSAHVRSETYYPPLAAILKLNIARHILHTDFAALAFSFFFLSPLHPPLDSGAMRSMQALVIGCAPRVCQRAKGTGAQDGGVQGKMQLCQLLLGAVLFRSTLGLLTSCMA